MEPAVRFQDVSRHFGEVRAVRLQFREYEIFFRMMDCVGVNHHVPHDFFDQQEVGVVTRLGRSRGFFEQVKYDGHVAMVVT